MNGEPDALEGACPVRGGEAGKRLDRALSLTPQQSEDGLCGSHLLRELEFVIDSNGYAWALNMKRLLKETCARV
ncbi:MAG: hypothetical protein HKN43_02175, partial [Rhodothermales bacterium]|nr:hypothetical protein [Rhodothermales bacterium]